MFSVYIMLFSVRNIFYIRPHWPIRLPCTYLAKIQKKIQFSESHYLTLKTVESNSFRNVKKNHVDFIALYSVFNSIYPVSMLLRPGIFFV